MAWGSSMKVIASSNAIVMEIVKSALASISAEMGAAAARGGYSSLLKEGGDASSAIFDAKAACYLRAKACRCCTCAACGHRFWK